MAKFEADIDGSTDWPSFLLTQRTTAIDAINAPALAPVKIIVLTGPDSDDTLLTTFPGSLNHGARSYAFIGNGVDPLDDYDLTRLSYEIASSQERVVLIIDAHGDGG